MSTVDERIVNMKIDNKQFISGAKSSQSALNNLNKTVNSAGKGAGGMAALGAATEGVKHKFSLLNAAAVTAVATITTKLVNAGLNMVKSFTLDPIMDGFREYQTNLNSIQTIMANTGAKVGVVNKYLNDLNHYSDATIYSFSNMASAIGKFTAAGVPLKSATVAIKGMANSAALGGSSVEQLNTAMVQVSQALAAGSIKLQDWNSVNTAGMGGTNMQKAFRESAKSMGTDVDGIIAKAGNFRESLRTGWLETGVFNKAMKVMAGTTNKAGKTVAYTVKQLKGMGYSTQAAKDLHRLSGAAIDAATKIKTFPQLLDVVKESIGSGWAKIFQDLMGNFNESTKLWTGVGQAITGVVSKVFGSIDKALVGWRNLGGYNDMWKGLGNIFQALGNIIRPFVQAFQSILPGTKKAGSGLKSFSSGFLKATDWLEKFTRGASGLGPILNIVAQAFTIALHVIGGVVKYFAALLPLVAPLAQGLGSLAEDISQVVVGFLKWADLGSAIDGVFKHIIDGRQKALGPIVKTVGEIIAAFGRLVHGDVSGFTNQFKSALSNLTPLGKMISDVMGKIQAGFAKVANSGGVVGKISGALSTAAGKVRDFADGLVGAFNAFRGGSAKSAESSTAKMAMASTSLADGGAKLIDVLKRIGTWIKNAAVAVGHGISSVWQSLMGLTQGIDKIDLISAFALIFDGAVLLSVRNFIKKFQGYVNTFGGMGDSIKGSFDQLTGTLKTMQNGVKSKIILNIAIAIGILAGALWVLSKIPAKQLAISLGALGAMFLMLNLSMKSFSTLLASPGFKAANLIAMAAAMTLMGFAMIEFATAVAILGNLDMATLAKGLLSLAIGMKLMTMSMQGMSNLKGILAAAAAMVIMSFALEAMAGVIITFAAINWDTFTSGMVKMGAALAVIVLAMKAMPTTSMLANSAGMVAIAFAMTVLAGALALFGNMDIGTIVKGLLTMGAALLILVVAMNKMQGAVSGAVAMVLVSGAILVMSGALKTMGSMDMASIGKSLLVLTAALVIFLAAAALAKFVAGGLITLGIAIGLVGVGMLAAGIGMAAFAAGLAVLVGLGTAAFAVIQGAIQVFLAMLPLIVLQVAAAFVSFLNVMAAASPKIAKAFVKIVSNMISAANRLLPKLENLFNNFLGHVLHSIDKNAPKFGHTFQVLLNTCLSVLRNNIPKMVNTGMDILQGLLNGIRRKLPNLMSTTTDIVVKFVNGISNHLDRVAAAGVNLIIKFIAGVSKNAVKLANSAAKAILDFLHGINSAVNRYQGQIQAAGVQIGVSVARGFISGIGSLVGQAASAARSLASNAISAIHSVVKNPPFPSREGLRLGYSLAYGFTSGIVSGHKEAASAASALGLKSIDATQKVLDINSPSKVFRDIGINVTKGFVKGIVQSLNLVKAAGVIMAKDAIDTVTKTTTDLQLKADAQAAKADALRFAAEVTRQKLHHKGLSKRAKAHINARAKVLTKAAEASAKASAATQAKVDAINKKAEDKRAFAEADTQGKADILNQRALDAAAVAEERRKTAIKLEEEANRIRKLDAKRAKALAKQAQKALASSKRAAESAKSNSLEAQKYAIQAVLNSSGSVATDLNAWLAQNASDKAYEAMTTEQKKTEMERRAAEDTKKSDDLIKSARDKLAQATVLSSTNAKAAQLLVDSAAADVEAAKAAKDQAEQEAQSAKDLVDTPTGPDTTEPAVDANDLAAALKIPSTNIASSAVYGAQNMFDAYAKALTATTAAAAADKQAPISFVQNNNSPVALTPSEVYRQTNNLLSNAERKLAGASK